jgi:hypothetical protein
MANTSKLDLDQVLSAAQAMDGTGFCLSCGAEAGGVEPDARKDKCEACGTLAVYGAEEIIMMAGFSGAE